MFMRRVHPTTFVLAACFAAQIGIGIAIKGIQPFWSALPPVPTERALAAEAFGDGEFLYRLLVMDLQNFGDTGGHLTRMADYDMPRVIGWLRRSIVWTRTPTTI